MLIDKVPDLNVANAKGQTPLHLAAFCRVQSDGLELMVDANSALNEKAQDGRTPLHLACTKGPPSRVQYLLHHNAEINVADNEGNFPIHLAAKNGLPMVLNILIEQGANVHSKGAFGMLPLHMACLYSHIECVRLLSEQMSSKEICETLDGEGRSVLHAAACGGSNDCLRMIIEQGVEVNSKDKNKRTPLHYSAAHAKLNCITELVANRANVNVADKFGRSPLHYVSTSDEDGRCVSFLLKKQAKPAKKDTCSYNPAHYAARFGKKLVLQMLLDSAAGELLSLDVAMPKTTPLHLASYHGHYTVVDILARHLHTLDAKDAQGRTALDLAAFQGHTEVLEVLISQISAAYISSNAPERLEHDETLLSKDDVSLVEAQHNAGVCSC